MEMEREEIYKQEGTVDGIHEDQERAGLTTSTVETNTEPKAEEVQKTGSQNYTHKFKKPVEIMGVKYKELTFYFDNLTGEDIEAIEEEMADQQRYAISPEISSTFQSMLAARAAKIPSDEIRRLPISEYMKIKNEARNFLVNAGL